MLNDVIVYVVGNYDENEVLLGALLTTISECINYYTKDLASKKTIMENYEQLILTVDELIDEG
jgi:hypothetical protein